MSGQYAEIPDIFNGYAGGVLIGVDGDDDVTVLVNVKKYGATHNPNAVISRRALLTALTQLGVIGPKEAAA
ncbi:hypothetical protein DDP54_15720 (plasmid) [Cellulomonas sp. WB94]|uniref:hypothetical protein n=1 Tax=Cellulomonas sp. WB94 TaxID=2173174 RepID=UPI000D576F60|nr:hypothetical protein [Cellulomonas sp. WB94]PVU81348.1 hypothetical protein DDP54_15720 [Cellulomonas sp. WB94]